MLNIWPSSPIQSWLRLLCGGTRSSMFSLALSCSFLLVSLLSEVGVFQCIDWLFVSVGVFFFNFGNYQIDTLLGSLPSHESGRTTQHSHTQSSETKQLINGVHSASWVQTEEVLERKSSGSGLEKRQYGRRDLSRWRRGILYPQKLPLTSLTGGGRSASVVRSRT
jgi:hypothetical protein